MQCALAVQPGPALAEQPAPNAQRGPHRETVPADEQGEAAAGTVRTANASSASSTVTVSTVTVDTTRPATEPALPAQAGGRQGRARPRSRRLPARQPQPGRRPHRHCAARTGQNHWRWLPMRLPAQGCRVRRSGGVLIHVVPHRVGPGPAATSANGRRRLLLPAATPIGFAAGELLVARLVPATQLGLAGPVLLLAAVLCLLAEDRLVRPAHPQHPRRATATAGQCWPSSRRSVRRPAAGLAGRLPGPGRVLARR